MSSQPRVEPKYVKFLDNFLQESNIKWVLAAGMLILIGSSCMIVMSHWDAFEPMWKFLTIAGYTSAIFVVGWTGYHKFALRKTGTALLALAVLMTPMSFRAWHWLWIAGESVSDGLAAVALLGLYLVVATMTSRRTFRHFLRGDQPTFVASYLILSLAAAIAPAIGAAGGVWPWPASVVLWGIFSIGVVKVNRHVFWLTEERHFPRVFGFFPIVLLGGQFLMLFAAYFARAFSVSWLGFGCVLVAIPVLLTADAVARVFQQRTGNLIKPIPWSILLPLIAGLMLCVTAVVLAGTAIADRTPYAMVPTAALCACMMIVIARRTNRAAFVWAMLAAVVLAYNFAPVYFQTLARAAVAQGAAAVRETRLPLAFYGLTYLPLILATSGVAALLERRGNLLFARPLRRFCVGIAWLLLAASLGHVKAFFPVAMVMIGVFALQTRLFRDRRLALAAVIAFQIASVGAAPFVEHVFAVPLPACVYYWLPLGSMVALLACSPWLDPRIRRLTLESEGARSDLAPWWTSMCRWASLVGTILVAIGWMLPVAGRTTELGPGTSLLIAGALFVQSLVWMRSGVSWIAYIFSILELVRSAFDGGASVSTVAMLVCGVWLVQWAFTYWFAWRPQGRVSSAWAAVNRQSAWCGLLLSTVLVALPDLFEGTLGYVQTPLRVAENLLLTAWCFDAGRRLPRISLFDGVLGGSTRCVQKRGLDASGSVFRQPKLLPLGVQSPFLCKVGSTRWLGASMLSALGCLCVLGDISSLMVKCQGLESRRWIVVAWAAAAIAALPLVEYFRRRLSAAEREAGNGVDSHAGHALRAMTPPIEAMMYGVFGAFAVVSLLEFSIPIRWAGCLSLGGLLVATFLRPHPLRRAATMALANWAMIVAGVQWCAPHATNLVELLWMDSGLAAWCVAASASTSLLLWIGPHGGQTPNSVGYDLGAHVRSAQRIGLRLLS